MGLLVKIKNSLFGSNGKLQTTNRDNLARIAREVVPIEEYPDCYKFPILTDIKGNTEAWIKEMSLIRKIDNMYKAEMKKIKEKVLIPRETMVDNYLNNSSGFAPEEASKWSEKIDKLEEAGNILTCRAGIRRRVKTLIVRGIKPSDQLLDELEKIETECQNWDGLNALKEVRQRLSLQERPALSEWKIERPDNARQTGKVETGRIRDNGLCSKRSYR
jgi:hypothetical protein